MGGAISSMVSTTVATRCTSVLIWGWGGGPTVGVCNLFALCWIKGSPLTARFSQKIVRTNRNVCFLDQA